MVGCIAKILLNSVVFESAGLPTPTSDTRAAGVRSGTEHGAASGCLLKVWTSKANVHAD